MVTAKANHILNFYGKKYARTMQGAATVKESLATAHKHRFLAKLRARGNPLNLLKRQLLPSVLKMQQRK